MIPSAKEVIYKCVQIHNHSRLSLSSAVNWSVNTHTHTHTHTLTRLHWQCQFSVMWLIVPTSVGYRSSVKLSVLSWHKTLANMDDMWGKHWKWLTETKTSQEESTQQHIAAQEIRIHVHIKMKPHVSLSHIFKAESRIKLGAFTWHNILSSQGHTFNHISQNAVVMWPVPSLCQVITPEWTPLGFLLLTADRRLEMRRKKWEIPCNKYIVSVLTRLSYFCCSLWFLSNVTQDGGNSAFLGDYFQ